MGRLIRILLVEDKDDPHVVSALLNYSGVIVQKTQPWEKRRLVLEFDNSGTDRIELHVTMAHGVIDLLERLPVECKTSDLDTLAAIVDADLDIRSRWDEVKLRLDKAGCRNVPKELPESGLVRSIPDGPRVGVWIMPDNKSIGMLEDFIISSLIPDDDPILPLVTAFIDSIPENICPFPPCHRSKAIIHAWLALRKNPGNPLGKAITERALVPGKEQCKIFLSWLHEMLVEPRQTPPPQMLGDSAFF
jgi:uncharacterized protein DUF3226